MKLFKKANKTTIKMTRKEWDEMGKEAGWSKEAQQLQQNQQDQQNQQQPQQNKSFVQGINPQVKKALMDAIQGSGLSLSKVSPFLEILFSNLGDIPISKVKEIMTNLEQTGI